MDKGSYDSYSDTSTESEPANDPQAEDTESTALVPKSLFGGHCKIGDVYRVKVVSIHESELEIAPTKDKRNDAPENASDQVD